MEKESFQLLVNEVKDYHEFIQRRGLHGNLYCKKAPVSYQLLVFLYVRGAVGYDANFKKVASHFKISHGLVQIFVERCTRALKSKLEVDTINWPDGNERRIISKRFQDKYGFANCIGFVDGRVFPLVFKPTEYGEDYWYRKGGYAIHSLIICDDEMRILDYLVGYPGSVHDNRVWSKTDQCNHTTTTFLAYNIFWPIQHLLSVCILLLHSRGFVEFVFFLKSRNCSTLCWQRLELKLSIVLDCSKIVFHAYVDYEW
jgi:hypothetical protein